MNAAAKLENATEFRVQVTIFTKTNDPRKTLEKNYKSEIFANVKEAEDFIEALPLHANYTLQFRTPQLKVFKSAYGSKLKGA
jgi:FAD synthase